jgi:PKD repeat protein
LPNADLGGPHLAVAGESVTLDASGSTTPEGSLTNYYWVFGDGSLMSETGLATADHVYANPGIYTATVVVSKVITVISLMIPTAMACRCIGS